jgi:hypothetical protein
MTRLLASASSRINELQWQNGELACNTTSLTIKTTSVMLVVPMLVSGCVAFPELPPERRVDVADVLTNIECEIQNELDENFEDYPFLVQWAAAVDMTLLTKNNSGGTIRSDLVVPLVPEVFQLDVDFSPDHQRFSSGNLDYSFYLKDLPAGKCDGYDVETRTFTNPRRRAAPVLTGRTGVGDWITRVVSGVRATGSCPTNIVFNTHFQITYSGNGAPSISGVEAGDATVGGGFTFGPRTEQNHALIVTLGPISPNEKREIVDDAFDRIQERFSALGNPGPVPTECLELPKEASVVRSAPPKSRSRQAPRRLPTVSEPVQRAPSGTREPVGEATQRKLDAEQTESLIQELQQEVRDID